jgi:uncharacterized 2Fe-2S/4Fe-4S cluster protein (DUF4445 family)
VLATEAAMNPQVRYGEDLMSRVSYAMAEPQGLARLNRAILRTLDELVEKAAESAGLSPEDILDAVIVGNTVMHHILLGINPKELGGAPFALATNEPLDLKARDLGLSLNPAAQVHILPIIAGHVGADNVAVQLSEAPQDQDEIMLVVDVGTNAEIVLGDRQLVLAASSPTGPAFEGAQITHGQRAAPGAIERVRIDPQTYEPRVRLIGSDHWVGPDSEDPAPGESKATGICGSGIIEAVAELFLAGVIDRPFRQDGGRAHAPGAFPGPDGRVYPGRRQTFGDRLTDHRHTERYPPNPAGQGSPVCRDEAADGSSRRGERRSHRSGRRFRQFHQPGACHGARVDP